MKPARTKSASRTDFFLLVLVFIVYLTVGKLGLSFTYPSVYDIWPLTGIALAACLMFGNKVWPAILLSAFILNITTVGTNLTSFAIAIGSTLEAMVGAHLLQKYAEGQRFTEQVSTVFKFLTIVIFCAVPISATLGVTSLVLGGLVQWSQYRDIWLNWWLGDLGGAFVITPFILLWSKRKYSPGRPLLLLKTISLLTLLTISTALVFGPNTPIKPIYGLTLLPLPLLYWISYLTNTQVSSLAIVINTAFAFLGTQLGFGPFVDGASNNSHLLLHLYLNIVATSTLIFSVTIKERNKLDKRYRALIKHSYDVVSMVDSQANILFASDAVERVLGYTPKEITRFNGIDLIHPDDQPQVKEKLAVLLQKPDGMVTAEYRMKNKMNQWRWIEATGTNLLNNPDIGAIVVNFRDITEKRQIRQEILKLSEVVVQSPVMVMITDINGAITYVNPKFTNVTGYTPEEIIGKNPRILKSGASSNETYEKMWKTILTGEKWRGEFYNRKKNGEMYYEYELISPLTDSSGKIINFIALKEDITERKYLEQSLTSVRDRLSVIMDSMAEGLIVLDRQMHVSIINSSAESMLGISQGWAVGKDLSKIVTLLKNNTPVATEDRITTRVFATGKAIITSLSDNYTYQSVFGKTFPVISSVAPIFDKEIIGVIIIFRDITELKALDKAKSEFLSIAAHQLRAPLGITRWQLEMLKQGDYGKLPEQAEVVVNKLDANNQRLITLVGDLLNVTRIDQGKAANTPEDIAVPTVIGEIIEDMKGLTAQKSITLAFQSDLKPGFTIHLDPFRFRVVVQNIVSNSVKYSLPHGNIQIRVVAEQDKLVLTCKDTGIGIPKESLSLIFTKFFRAPNAVLHDAEGTGLGLYMVKSYIEGWRGTINITSTEGGGTEVTVNIPLHPKSNI